MIYEEVIFIDEVVDPEDYETWLDLMDNGDEYGAMEFLKTWHYFGEHPTRTDPGFGWGDNYYTDDDYTMAWNDRLKCVSLVFRVDED